MEKQTKVLNKINNSLKHGNEGQLGTKKNDECYTSMQDILNEMQYWANLGKFQGKSIICPCDWDITDGEDIYGIRIEYKENCVETNVYKTVKSVVVTKYNDMLSVEEESNTIKLVDYELKEEEIETFLRDKLTCNFLRTFTQNARAWGIKSITASGYNPANGKGIPFQDVDYSKYDICCTNPPFSLYADFMKAIVGNIDFIVLAPLLNRASPNVGQYLMLKQAYLGVGVHLALNFNNPTKENKYHTKSVACDWITSFREAQDERNARHFKSGISYDLYKDEFAEMPNMTMKDGTHPIRVPAQFPDDYNGWMFGGINILDNLDQEAYEWYGLGCKGYLNSHLEYSPLNHKFTPACRIGPDGKAAFEGIVFRKKPEVK